MLARIERRGFVVPAHERLVLPDVGLDPGVGPAFGQHPPDGPHQLRLDPQGEREPGEDLVGQLLRVLVAQERRSCVQLAASQGRIVQSRASSSRQRLGWQGTRASAGFAFAWNRRPHSSHTRIEPIPLFLLARQAAEITQHQHDGARIGQRDSGPPARAGAGSAGPRRRPRESRAGTRFGDRRRLRWLTTRS